MSDRHADRPAPPPRTWLSHVIGVCVSLLLHTVVLSAAGWTGPPSGLDVDLELPSEVEFGLSQQVEISAAPATPAPQPPSGGAQAEAEREGPGPMADAGAEEQAGPGEADAGSVARDAGADRKADAGGLLARRGDAGPAALAKRRAAQSTLPAGAHLGLRLHMGRLRGTPLAPRMRKLLDIIRDWRQVLDGSGVDPMDDLRRVFIAHPGKATRHGYLDPTRWVVAGEHRHDERFVRDAVQRIAEANHRPLDPEPWTRSPKLPAGVRIAPWHDRDPETERVLAMLGTKYFTITRKKDLGAVLAVAMARNDERRGGRHATAPDALAEGLLSMAPGALLSVEGHGLRKFVGDSRHRRFAPTGAHVFVRRTEDSGYILRATGRYETQEAAKAARKHWQGVRDRNLRQLQGPLAAIGARALLGFDPRPVIRKLELTTEGQRLKAETSASGTVADGVLGLVFRIVRGNVHPSDLAEGALEPGDEGR